MASLKGFVDRQRPDVLVLEETPPAWQRQLGLVADALPFQTGLLPKGRQDVTILSRWPITDFAVLTPLGPTGGRLPYHIVRAELDADGRKLVVYGVHPPHPMDGSEWGMRNAYFAWLAHRVALEPEGTAVIVAGDFNSALWSPFFQDYLTDRRRHDAARSNWPAPTRHPYWPDGWRWIGIPIDHVTVSPAVGIAGFSRRPRAGLGSLSGHRRPPPARLRPAASARARCCHSRRVGLPLEPSGPSIPLPSIDQGGHRCEKCSWLWPRP